jgi:uncharacterized RDD family membrane protein YckC
VVNLDHESILGLDNIRLELPVAGVGSRTLAAFLDYLILLLLLLLWTVIWSVLAVAMKKSSWTLVALLAGYPVLEWSYFAVSEILGGGRTLGKRAIRLRVITAEGGTPGAGALVARNLVRSLDLLFGIPLMAVDPLARRLGDRLAGTLVVHERRTVAAPIIGRVPPGWGPRELAAVESFLARAQGLEDPARTYEMADRILDRLRRDSPELLEGLDVRGNPVEVIRRALQVEEG